MITLKINNWFQKDSNYTEQKGSFYYMNECIRECIKSYDEEKWKDGRTYKFETLKEVHDFCQTCNIDFTDEFRKSFDNWNWYELDFTLHIDNSEDNLMIFNIRMHEEWLD